MQHTFTPSWSTILSLNFLMCFFKTKLDNAPENTFENNPALTGWWIRWSSQYFLVIFSMVHFILCYIIVLVQHPGTTQRLYLIDPTAQTFDVLFLVDPKATLGMSGIPPLCPSQPRTCRAQAVLSCRVCRNTTQPTHRCCWDRKISSPCSFFLQRLWAWEVAFNFLTFRTFSTVTDEWRVAALSMMCSMAQGCLSHSGLMALTLPPYTDSQLRRRLSFSSKDPMSCLKFCSIHRST